MPLLAGRTLYLPEFEHDACGVGFVASTRGECSKRILRLGLTRFAI